MDHDTQQKNKERNQKYASFQIQKENCLGKRDKSNAGRIDPKAVDICAAINARSEYYTTSSCSGRCFLYCGDGIKSHHHYATTTTTKTSSSCATKESNNNDDEQINNGHGFFQRFRVNHDLIQNPKRYFNLNTLFEDLDGGGDPIRTIGQFDSKSAPKYLTQSKSLTNTAIWLRFEPFILHVACRSLDSANALMSQARPSFKNVGLTSWKENKQSSNYIVAIWGDEGLDMPLSVPSTDSNLGQPLLEGKEIWLQSLINERHVRNWSKIQRFTQAVKTMSIVESDNDYHDHDNDHDLYHLPKRYDVIGDVAIINHPNIHSSNLNETDSKLTQSLQQLGQQILKKNKHIKMCVVRTQALSSSERCSKGLYLLAGCHDRYPKPYPPTSISSSASDNNKDLSLLTSHTEYGIKCVISITQTFFSPRMGPERLRLCQQVARGERVLVLFCGCGMEALQLAGRTEAQFVIGMDINSIAIDCANRGKRMLERNKTVKCKGASDRVSFIHGDVLDLLSQQTHNFYDRILAPRPKDDDNTEDDGKGSGEQFLRALIPVLKQNGGECHWYDFCADWELPDCMRTRTHVKQICYDMGLGMEVIHVASVGSIAKRQYRVCMDFRLTGKLQ